MYDDVAVRCRNNVGMGRDVINYGNLQPGALNPANFIIPASLPFELFTAVMDGRTRGRIATITVDRNIKQRQKVVPEVEGAGQPGRGGSQLRRRVDRDRSNIFIR